jgi:hypothetical protein
LVKVVSSMNTTDAWVVVSDGIMSVTWIGRCADGITTSVRMACGAQPAPVDITVFSSTSSIASGPIVAPLRDFRPMPS